MIQILIIGRSSRLLASKLDAEGAPMEVNTERLPAAGVREIEKSPPDAVIIEAPSSIRALSLAIAIKSRPIGEFIPVIALAPDNSAEDAPGRDQVAALLPPSVDIKTLIATLEEALGLDPNELETSEVPRTLDEPTSPSPDEEDEEEFFLEEIVEEAASEIPESAPTKISTKDIFAARHQAARAEAVDEATVRRKLKAVRHEDYFSILEIPRSAETHAVRDAFHRLRESYTQSIEFDLSHRYQDELDEIRDAFEDAWAVLGDPELRAAYLEHTTR